MAVILAADIGGTSSRFGRFEARPGEEPRLEAACSIPTSSVGSFEELLALLWNTELSPASADAIALAVAGPVQDGKRCKLTNASWEVDLDVIGRVLPHRPASLVNDFVAQALGSRTAYALGTAVSVQDGVGGPGVTAAVGPGTGLGLCALAPMPDGGVLPLPSEGGHAPLAFVNRREFEFLEFLKDRTGHSHAFGDIVLSGRGLTLLHLFLTGRQLEPAAVAAEIGSESRTARWFSRFFARACRAYVLNVLAWGGLALCGGLAAKNPFLATSPEFLREFVDCPAYGALLGRVPVRLIVAPDTGLYGAASLGESLLGRP